MSLCATTTTSIPSKKENQEESADSPPPFFNPSQPIASIKITSFNADQFTLEYNCINGKPELFPAGQKILVDYVKFKNGAKIIWNRSDSAQKSIYRNTHFLEVLCKNLKFLVENQVLDRFIFFITHGKLFVKFVQKFLNPQFPIKAFYIHLETGDLDQHQIFTILSHFHPEILDWITIFNGDKKKKHMDISRVVELEQWKKASILYLVDMVVATKIENLAHFSGVQADVKSVSVEDVMVLKESGPALSDLIHLLGRPLVPKNCTLWDTKSWFFENSQNPTKFVQIELADKAIYIRYQDGREVDEMEFWDQKGEQQSTVNSWFSPVWRLVSRVFH